MGFIKAVIHLCTGILLALAGEHLDLNTPGVIQSKNYPSYCPSLETWSWFLTANGLIRLDFSDFRLDKYFDKFTIDDLSGGIISFTGTDLHKRIFRTSSFRIKLSFETGIHGHRRFRLKWSTYTLGWNQVVIPITGIRFSIGAHGMRDWIQSTDDDFDWSFTRDSTPTSGTGPSCGHTNCTWKDYYAYIETSTPRKEGDKARLLTRYSILPISDCVLVNYWFHGYGHGLQSLRLLYADAYSPQRWRHVWRAPTWSLNRWMQKAKRIYESDIILGFEGVRGHTDQGDYALDDVIVYDCHFSNTTAASPKTTTTATTVMIPTPTITPSCYKDLSGDSGVVKTPNYPGKYPLDTHCEWTITARDSDIILNIEDVRVGSWQVLYIRDVYLNKLIYHISERYPKRKMVYTKTAKVRLTFIGGDGIGYVLNKQPFEGFKISWITESAHFVHRYETSGRLTSFGYPSNYPLDITCIWTIEETDDVYLRVNSFELEKNRDSLRMRRRGGEDVLWSGHVENDTCFNTESSYIVLTFHSDSVFTLSGFDIEWSTSSCAHPDLSPGEYVAIALAVGVAGILLLCCCVWYRHRRANARRSVPGSRRASGAMTTNNVRVQYRHSLSETPSGSRISMVQVTAEQFGYDNALHWSRPPPAYHQIGDFQRVEPSGSSGSPGTAKSDSTQPPPDGSLPPPYTSLFEDQHNVTTAPDHE